MAPQLLSLKYRNGARFVLSTLRWSRVRGMDGKHFLGKVASGGFQKGLRKSGVQLPLGM